MRVARRVERWRGIVVVVVAVGKIVRLAWQPRVCCPSIHLAKVAGDGVKRDENWRSMASENKYPRRQDSIFVLFTSPTAFRCHKERVEP